MTDLCRLCKHYEAYQRLLKGETTIIPCLTCFRHVEGVKDRFEVKT